MKTAKQLREERAAKLQSAQELTQKATTEKREFSADEATQFDNLEAEIRGVDAEIERAEKRERLAGQAASQTAPLAQNARPTEEARAARGYSFLTAIRAAGDPGSLSGLEKEMHEEASREARAAGVAIEGVGVPLLVLQGRERRDNSVTMPTQPEDGAVLVREEFRDMISLLRDQLVTRQLGATVLTGLQGNIQFPTHTQGAVSTWKQEVENLDKSNIKFGQKSMTPHRLGTYSDISKQLIIQSSIDIEAFVRNEIINSVNVAVDRAAIYGDGLDNEPLGLLNTTDIAKFIGGANGAIPDLATLVALESMVEVNNAATGRLGYLMSNKIKGTLKTQPVAEGTPLMVLNGTQLNGYDFVASNFIKDAAKGTATAASAIIFGNWSDLIIGQWGGLDITTDPFTLARLGQVRVVINTFWDIMVRRPESFAAMLDAVPNATISQAAVNA